jgi:DNA-binding response OmpR family regulator
MATILLVDSDTRLAATLRERLEREQHTVVIASDVEAAVSAVNEREPGLVLVDPGLPGAHGFDVCRTLRRATSAPIIVVTAEHEELSKVVALELGADDYVTKPFSTQELLARVNARLRRTGSQPSTNHVGAPLAVGDLRIDLMRREVLKGDHVVGLRPKEYDLLVFLMQHPGQTLSRAHLLRSIWGYQAPGKTRTVDVHIDRLRGKIEDEPARPRWIITVRGIGYRLEP